MKLSNVSCANCFISSGNIDFITGLNRFNELTV